MGIDLVAGLDPRSKLVAFLAVQALLFIPSPSQPPLIRLVAVAVPLLAVLPVAGRSWRLMLRVLAMVAPLLAILAFSILLMPTAARPAPHSIILPIIGKSILVSLSLALFILNEEPRRMLQALRQIRIPQSAVVVLAIGYRFASQWRQELEGVRRAWTARNFSALSKLRRARCLGGALPLFFDRLLEGAIHIHDAMVSRGFHGSLPSWQRLNFSRRDKIFLTLVASVAAAIAML